MNQFLVRMHRRLWIGEFLRAIGRWLALYLLIFGLIALGVKILAPNWGEFLYAGLLGLPGLVIWGARQAGRKRFSPGEMVAYLDRRADAGGLLMTLWENPDSAWREKLSFGPSARHHLPAIVPEPFFRVVAIPTMFLAGALALPTREPPAPAPRDTVASRVTSDLQDAIHILESDESLDASTRAQLESEVQQLTTAIAGKPISHESWETVDAVKEQMWSLVQGRHQSLLQGESALGHLARSLDSGVPLKAETLNQLQSELAGALPGVDLEHLQQFLPPEVLSDPALQAVIAHSTTQGEALPLQEIVKNPALQAAAFQMLQGELDRERQEFDTLQQALGRTLWEVEPSSRSEFSRLMASGEARASRLNPSESQIQSRLVSPDPRASTSASDTAMTMGGSQPLSQEAPSNPREHDSNSLAGVTLSGDAGTSEISAKIFADAETWKRTLRPRHRDVVQRYFGVD